TVSSAYTSIRGELCSLGFGAGSRRLGCGPCCSAGLRPALFRRLDIALLRCVRLHHPRPQPQVVTVVSGRAHRLEQLWIFSSPRLLSGPISSTAPPGRRTAPSQRGSPVPRPCCSTRPHPLVPTLSRG